MKRICGRLRCAAIPTVLILSLTAVMAVFPMSAQTARKLKVVASTSDLAALASEVGGDRTEVEYLAPAVQDPHTVPGKASYLLKLQHADLLIVVGMELDVAWLTGRHHIASAISQSGNRVIQPGASGYFDASRFAEILERPAPPFIRDIHPVGNPHYWLDPDNGRGIAQALAQRLSELRPNDASYFENRLRTFSKRLSEAEVGWTAEMHPYRGSKVVTYRRSWSYLLMNFQLVSVGEIEPSPGIPPNRAHTTELIALMKREGAKVIMVEPYFEMKTPNTIAREVGAKVVIMPSSVGGEKEITDYFKLFDYDLALLAKAFQAAR